MVARDDRVGVDRQHVGREVFPFQVVDRDPVQRLQRRAECTVDIDEAVGVNQQVAAPERIEAAVQMQLAVRDRDDLDAARPEVVA